MSRQLQLGSTSKTASRYKMTWFVPHSGGACEREARCWATELSQPSHSARITYNLQGTRRSNVGALMWEYARQLDVDDSKHCSAAQPVKSRPGQPLTLGARSIESRVSCCYASTLMNGRGWQTDRHYRWGFAVTTPDYQITSNSTLTRSTE